VRQVFEDALTARIVALIHAWNAPGPDFLFDPVLIATIPSLVRGQLPLLWPSRGAQGRREP